MIGFKQYIIESKNRTEYVNAGKYTIVISGHFKDQMENRNASRDITAVRHLFIDFITKKIIPKLHELEFAEYVFISTRKKIGIICKYHELQTPDKFKNTSELVILTYLGHDEFRDVHDEKSSKELGRDVPIGYFAKGQTKKMYLESINKHINVIFIN